jgi:hypothetical protein
MKITLEVTVTGLEGWDMDWSDDEGVKMELVNVEEEVRHAIADRVGINLENLEVEAKFDRGN